MTNDYGVNLSEPGILSKVISLNFVKQLIDLGAFMRVNLQIIPCYGQYMPYGTLWSEWLPSDHQINCLSVMEEISGVLQCLYRDWPTG